MRFLSFMLQEAVTVQDETEQKIKTWQDVKEVHLCLSYSADNKLSGELQAKNVSYKALSRDKGFIPGQRVVGGDKVLQVEYAVVRGRHTALFLSEVV